MRNGKRKLFRGVFGAAVAGALGLGVGQAFAEPVLAAGSERCTSAMHSVCRDNCIAEGFTGGRCDIAWGVTVCECY